MLMQARIERRTLPDTGRVIAISDVHGNLEYLQGLLKKLDLRDEDTLVFCGDIMEKGPQSLDTLHFLMDLNERRRCWFVLGTTSTTTPSPAGTGMSGTTCSPTPTATAPGCCSRCATPRE